MEQNPKSEGKCLFCGETFVKACINRHLQTYLKQKTKENAAGHSYLLKIESNPKWDSSPYFLSFWVNSTDKVFYKGLKLEYKHDFGSTTELLLTVVEEYPVKDDEKIVLLSCNEPLECLLSTLHAWECVHTKAK
ncbi:MAG: hypothetical protein LBS69_06085 [Prevotellaceae bacterium]|jgi:hypothetical protein|nr:hypothetical protein [Prevotellaceae bacterium]